MDNRSLIQGIINVDNILFNDYKCDLKIGTGWLKLDKRDEETYEGYNSRLKMHLGDLVNLLIKKINDLNKVPEWVLDIHNKLN